MTEQLTPTPQNTYPVERRNMDTEVKEIGISGKEAPEARLAKLVERVKADKEGKGMTALRAKADDDRKKTDEKGGSGGSVFAGIDASRFKDNKHLEELARKVQIAAKKGEADDEFLENIQREQERLVGLGLVSDNWSYQFTNYLRSFTNETQNRKDVPQELALDIEAIVAQRRKKGLTSDEAQASRVVWENTLGRKLTEAEYQRITTGNESIKTSKEFGAQVNILERIVGSKKRFDSFINSIEKIDAESIKQAMSGKTGEVVLLLLLGDVAERDDLVAEFKKAVGGGVEDVKFKLADITRQIQNREKSETPDPIDQMTQEEAKKALLADLLKKRQITAEQQGKALKDLEAVGISGGADEKARAEGMIEFVESLSEEDGEEFQNGKAKALGDDFIDYLAAKIYPVDDPRLDAERARFNALSEIDNPDVFKRQYASLMRDLVNRSEAAENDPKREEEKKEAKGAAAELIRTGELRKGTRSFNIRGLEEIVQDERFWQSEPRNVEQVAIWIMASDDKKTWGPDGIYPLFTLTGPVDSETGKPKPEFQAQNFIRWVRNKSLEHHNDNSNDPISLLNSVNIETLYKPISILTMKYNKQKYFSDAKGELLEALADEVIHEAWLFGVRRNNNLGYIQNMNADGELYKTVAGIAAKNDHTSGSNLVDYLKQGEEFDGKEGNKDNKVGDAMVAMNQIYRNLSDIHRLRQILPEGSPLFTLDGFKNAARVLNKQNFDEETDGFGNLTIDGKDAYYTDPRTKVKKYLFKEGELVLTDKHDTISELSKIPQNLVDFLNIFPQAQPENTNEQFVRELVKQSVAKMVGYDTGASYDEYIAFNEKIRKNDPTHENMDISKYRKIARINLEWAETNSWVEQRWSGAASRNDTGYRGYDAWTKLYAQYYRERQSGSKTAGPIGNPHDMQIFRMMGPDMWLALRTESGVSAQEIFDKIHAINLALYKHPEGSDEWERLSKEKLEAYKELKFPRWTESDWSSNGFKRQFEVWHSVMETEDIKFNEIVKRDNWGILKFDRAKFEEVVKDDFIKKRRYAFSSNGAMNYGAITRMRERVGLVIGKDGTVEKEEWAYKDKYLAEAMFGEVVMGSIRRDWYEGKIDFKTGNEKGKRVTKRAKGFEKKAKDEEGSTFQEYLNSADAREKILKNVCRAGLAAQLKAHRQLGGLDERWDNHSVRKFYSALRSMPQYIEDPQTGKQIKLDNSQFFSEDDIEWIRKQTGTTKSAMLMEDLALLSGDFMADAVPTVFKRFFDDTFDDLLD